MERLAATLCLLGLAALTGTVAWRRTQREPRRLSNAVWIVTAAVLTAFGLTAAGAGGLFAMALLVLIASPLLVVALVAFLFWNGAVMMRRESRSFGNLLSLLSGVALLVAAAASLGLLVVGERWLPLSVWIAMATAWMAVLFFGFLGYSWLYQRLARRRQPDYVVALGSGLLGGRVPPLLAARIDRALEVVWAERAEGRDPLLVMSGGQGPDEPTSEAAAMAAYAVSRGESPEAILIEDRSRSTEENLRFTAELVRQDPRLGADATGLAVTSNYHAMRAATLARRLSVPVQVLGAPTADYFWPSAVLREFVAVLRGSLGWQVVGFAVATVPLPSLILASMLLA